MYPVEITYVESGPLKGLPWLPPSKFLQSLCDCNDMHHILGGYANMQEAKPLLTTFWERYEQVFPDFELFAEIAAGKKRAEQCIPIYIHGYEGVTYKKGGVLILSWQCPLGYGTSRRPHEMSANLTDMGEMGLPLNLLKSGMYSRMLTIVCQKDWYSLSIEMGDNVFWKIVFFVAQEVNRKFLLE